MAAREKIFFSNVPRIISVAENQNIPPNKSARSQTSFIARYKPDEIARLAGTDWKLT